MLKYKSFKITPNDVLAMSEPIYSYGFDLIVASREGVLRTDFVEFAKNIKHSMQSLSSIIPASYSSLTKKKVFDLETSERIFELAELYARGKDVFGSIDTFNDWLHTVSIPLGGESPFSLLDTSFGIEIVKNEIGRIDHGVFA